MFLVSKPIEHAVKKIDNNPEKYLKKETIKNLIGDAPIKKAKPYNMATRFFKISADMIVAAPKGSLTILLIPPLLNLVFNKKQKTTQISPVKTNENPKNYVFFRSNTKNHAAFVAFKGNLF